MQNVKDVSETLEDAGVKDAADAGKALIGAAKGKSKDQQLAELNQYTQETELEKGDADYLTQGYFCCETPTVFSPIFTHHALQRVHEFQRA
jgi:hypothetical protein